MLTNTVLLGVVAALVPAAQASSNLLVARQDWLSFTDIPTGDSRTAAVKRQQYYCDNPGWINCPQDPTKCHAPGYKCCPDLKSTCKVTSTCLEDVPNAFWPPTPDNIPALAGQTIGCCPPGSNCSDPNWFNDLMGTDSTSTSSANVPAQTQPPATNGPTISLNGQSSVTINLANDVTYTGAWYAYAWAYASCSVWGANGQRVDVTSSASVATVQFGPDVKAVSVSMSESANAGAHWTVDGGSWDEQLSGSATASAGVNPDGSIGAMAAADCRWTKKFTLGSGGGSSNPLTINVKAGNLPESWLQINAIKGYGSESEMAQDIAPDDSSPLPSPSGASNSTNGSNAGGNTGSNTGGNTGSNTGGNTGGNIASSSPTVAGHASGTSGTGPTLGPAPAGPAAAGYANAPAFAFLVGGAIAGLAAM